MSNDFSLPNGEQNQFFSSRKYTIHSTINYTILVHIFQRFFSTLFSFLKRCCKMQYEMKFETAYAKPFTDFYDHFFWKSRLLWLDVCLCLLLCMQSYECNENHKKTIQRNVFTVHSIHVHRIRSIDLISLN